MLWLELHRSVSGTLTQQLYDQLVGRILDGELAAGAKLPSTREVASEHAGTICSSWRRQQALAAPS